jgi:HEPN domain-containing protein
MLRERFSPDDPREWLNRAKSNLARARDVPNNPEIYMEDLCFDAQQAAEKAIKAVMLHLDIDFPYVHNLTKLLTLVKQAGQDISPSLERVANLSSYAVETRYPSFSEPVTQQEYEESVLLAEQIIHWHKKLLMGSTLILLT